MKVKPGRGGGTHFTPLSGDGKRIWPNFPYEKSEKGQVQWGINPGLPTGH